MSPEEPRRPKSEAEPIKYGDLFNVSDELAKKPVAPTDAATMQSAENIVLGQTQKGGPAAIMQSAADINESRGVIGHKDATSAARDEGVTISEAEIGGRRIITEAIGGEIVGHYTIPEDFQKTKTSPDSPVDRSAITIAEALEAAALSAGDKLVDKGDAAAIQVAEVRATGRATLMPGGLAAEAQSAATQNTSTSIRPDEKIKLGDVLEVVLPSTGDLVEF